MVCSYGLALVRSSCWGVLGVDDGSQVWEMDCVEKCQGASLEKC